MPNERIIALHSCSGGSKRSATFHAEGHSITTQATNKDSAIHQAQHRSYHPPRITHLLARAQHLTRCPARPHSRTFILASLPALAPAHSLPRSPVSSPTLASPALASPPASRHHCAVILVHCAGGSWPGAALVLPSRTGVGGAGGELYTGWWAGWDNANWGDCKGGCMAVASCWRGCGKGATGGCSAGASWRGGGT